MSVCVWFVCVLFTCVCVCMYVVRVCVCVCRPCVGALWNISAVSKCDSLLDPVFGMDSVFPTPVTPSG